VGSITWLVALLCVPFTALTCQFDDSKDIRPVKICCSYPKIVLLRDPAQPGMSPQKKASKTKTECVVHFSWLG